MLPLLPKACGQQVHTFAGTVPPKGKPRWQPVAKLPPLALDVTEYQLHLKCCPCCATKIRTSFLDGMRWSMVGPRLAASMAMLIIQMQLHLRQVGLILDEARSRHFSAGTVQALSEEALAGLGKQFALWRRNKVGEFAHPPRRRLMQRRKWSFRILLDQEGRSQDPWVRGLSADLNSQ